MCKLLFLSLLIPARCYIPYWQPPPPIPVNVEIAGLPLPMMELQRPAPERFTNYPITPPIKEAQQLENPWLSMIKTVASVMNNSIDWEREKSRKQEINPENGAKSAAISYHSPTSNYNPINERNLYEPPNAGLVRLLNSMPPPLPLEHIGRFLDSSQQDKHLQEVQPEEKKSFPITKDNSINNFYDDGTVIGLITSGQLKNIDWTRKLLGIDELPTKEEGNAIAQLLEDH